MTDSFKDVIQQHLDLKRQNSHLEASHPLANYQLEAAYTTSQPLTVFDAEAEGAAFNTAEWSSERWSDTSHHRRRKTASFLESLEDVSNALDFNWDKRS